MNVKLRGWIAWFVTFVILMGFFDPKGFFGFFGVLILSIILIYPAVMVVLWMEFAARLYMEHRRKP